MTTVSADIGAEVAWRVSLCGLVTLTGADGEAQVVAGSQAQLVLAYLLIEDRPVQRDELADLLWEGPLPDHWAGAVRGLVAKVRAALVRLGLPEDCLAAERGILRLTRPAELVVDVQEAAGCVERAGVALSLGAPDQAVALARRATPTLRSLFLPRNDGPWVRHTRDRLDELAHLAAHREIEGHLALGDAGAAIQRAEDAVVDDPLDETAHHLLLRALIDQGQQVRALDAYERLRRQLATEYGIRPAAATEALYVDLVGATEAAPADEGAADPLRPRRPDPEPGTGTGPRRERARHLPAMAGPHGGLFVGRTDELTLLDGAWDSVASTRRPHVVVVAGEAGIGKTRLALEFARPGGAGRPALGATHVLWGRCRVDAGLPYEPIAEALHRRLVGDGSATQRRDDDIASGLFHLLPELAAQTATKAGSDPRAHGGTGSTASRGSRRPTDASASTGSAGPADAAVARAHLFRSVAAVLTELCEDPTLWVIDDLQWASQDTLTLLEFIVDELAAPLLLVITARDAPPEIDALLARLQRRVPVDTLTLDGLAADELAPLVTDLARRAGEDPSTVARTIAFRTGGNPFFIHEIAKDAARPGAAADPLAVPTAVREWIERRAASLPADAAAVLDLASVIGLDLDFDVLLACSPLDEATLLDRCDELVARGLLAEIGAGRFAFPHAITRDAVYERQRATRRTLLHRHVGQALAALPPVSGRASLLAFHFARAGASFRPLAFTHSMAAGVESLDQAAWSLAAEQLQAAVDLAGDVGSGVGGVGGFGVGGVGVGGDAERARALAHLGRARHGAGDADGARAVLEEAISIARRAKLPTELATAVLFLVGGGGRGVALGLPDADRAALIREALDGLGDDPLALGDHQELAGALEGELALALLLTDQVDDREAFARRSLERARLGAPGHALAQALLNVRLAKLGPQDVASRLADGAELLALAPAHRSPEQTLAALVNRHEDLLLLGDRAAARDALDRAIALAQRYAHPYWRWVCATWTTLGAIIDGHLDEAEVLAFEATTLQVGDHPEALACLGVNLIDIRLYQRRAGELLELIAGAAEENPHIPCYRAVLAMCAAESGDLDQACHAYAHFADDRFTTIPADTNRLLTLGVLAHTAVALDDHAGTPVLETLLTPYAGQQILLNCFGGGGSYWGPVTHQLARLAALNGRDADAQAFFAEAAASAVSFGAPLAAQRIADDLAARG